MEEVIETLVKPEDVWAVWEKVHSLRSTSELTSSSEGKKPFKYKIIQVKRGESFSIVWKSLFVRLIFNHSVRAVQKGSEICYKVEVKGLFAWPVRKLLGSKIRMNIRHVLKSMVQQLEDKRIK